MKKFDAVKQEISFVRQCGMRMRARGHPKFGKFVPVYLLVGQISSVTFQ